MTDRNVDDVVAALRTVEPELDDVHRARVLARMAPELDALAERYAERADARVRTHRRWWLPVLGVATTAAAGGLWLGRGEHAAAPQIAHDDRQVLAPYVVAGVASDDVATTLLAGRFAGLDAKSGELVRAVVDRDREQRVAVVGPAKLVARDDASLELVAGTLLVDARDPVRALHVRFGGNDVRAQNVRFGVATSGDATVVFVDRGELVIAGRHVQAGQWDGPEAQRSQALVAAVRDQGNAIAPPDDHAGTAAITAGSAANAGNIVTEGGAVVGPAPLWARLPAGDVVLVQTGAHERRTPVTIHEGNVSRIAVEPPPAPAPPPATPTPPVTIAPPAPSSSGRADHPLAAPPPATTHHAIGTTAAELYARAEAALGSNDRGYAESLWRELVQHFPHSPQAASALYDLAGLERARGDYAAAQQSLAKLGDGETPAALREPSAYLRCRLHVDAGEPTVAAPCFQAFRARFDKSAHDAEVLAWLIGYTQETAGCGAARALADEYLRRFPTGAFAARAKDCATP